MPGNDERIAASRGAGGFPSVGSSLAERASMMAAMARFAPLIFSLSSSIFCARNCG